MNVDTLHKHNYAIHEKYCFTSNKQKYGYNAKFEGISQKRKAENPIHCCKIIIIIIIIIIIQFYSILFTCWQDSQKANYRDSKEHKENAKIQARNEIT
jgi:hypothetical protein